MSQLLTADKRSPSAEELDAPRITLLGSLDNERGTAGLQLNAERPEPFLAIIYNGI